MKRYIVLQVAAGLAIGVFFSLEPAQAQGGGQAPPSGGGGAGPSTPRTSTPTPSPLPGSQERQRVPELERGPTFPEIRRPIFLSGKVMMEDGTPPPDQVVIERVCNGVARPEAYTDSKGRFSFEVGRNTMIMADASVSSTADQGFGGMGGTGTFGSQQGGIRSPAEQMGMSERDLMGCELRASLPGYRSDVVMLTGRRLFDNPDVGTIILHRIGNVEGTTISFTSLQAPKNARKSYDKGRNALRKGKWKDAQKELEKAVAAYPEYAAAWFELGRVLEQQNDVEGARNAYSKALAADAKFVNPYLQLAGISARERKWQEVADTTDRVVKLNPFDFPVAYFYNSVAQYNLQNLDAAEKSAREALKADKQHRIPKIDHVLGVILAQKGDFSAAVQHMRNYLKLDPDANDAELVKKQLAELERFVGPSASAQSEEQPQQ